MLFRPDILPNIILDRAGAGEKLGSWMLASSRREAIPSPGCQREAGTGSPRGRQASSCTNFVHQPLINKQ